MKNVLILTSPKSFKVLCLEFLSYLVIPHLNTKAISQIGHFGRVGSGRVVSILKFVGRFGWVCWILGWVGLGQEIWTHAHLWTNVIMHELKCSGNCVSQRCYVHDTAKNYVESSLLVRTVLKLFSCSHVLMFGKFPKTLSLVMLVYRSHA